MHQPYPLSRFCSPAATKQKSSRSTVTWEDDLAAAQHPSCCELCDSADCFHRTSDGSVANRSCRGHFLASKRERGGTPPPKKRLNPRFAPNPASGHLVNPGHSICEVTDDYCILDLTASIPFSCRQARKQPSPEQVARPLTRPSFGWRSTSPSERISPRLRKACGLKTQVGTSEGKIVGGRFYLVCVPCQAVYSTKWRHLHFQVRSIVLFCLRRFVMRGHRQKRRVRQLLSTWRGWPDASKDLTNGRGDCTRLGWQGGRRGCWCPPI